MKYDILIEKLMQFFTGQDFGADVSSAKKEFYEWAGVFDEEDPEFESKFAQFTDWYLFSRELLSMGGIPIQLAVKGLGFPIEEALQPFYHNLANSNHSLFEFLKLKGDDLYIKDILNKKKCIIRNSSVTLGFNREELFEARLIPHEDSFVFTGGFCFHPPQASRFIVKEIKKLKKLLGEEKEIAKQNFLHRLFRMRYKYEQYRHVDLKEIYSNDSKLRV